MVSEGRFMQHQRHHFPLGTGIRFLNINYKGSGPVGFER